MEAWSHGKAIAHGGPTTASYGLQRYNRCVHLRDWGSELFFLETVGELPDFIKRRNKVGYRVKLPSKKLHERTAQPGSKGGSEYLDGSPSEGQRGDDVPGRTGTARGFRRGREQNTQPWESINKRYVYLLHDKQLTHNKIKNRVTRQLVQSTQTQCLIIA